MDALYTTATAAETLQVSARWVRREAAHVGAQRVGRDWIITAAQLEMLRGKVKPVGRPAMNKIIIDESSLSDFLGADGDVTGAKLERRMDRYCAWIQARMENVRVTHGPTSGTDDVPDELREEYEGVAAQAADNLDIICGRGKLI